MKRESFILVCLVMAGSLFGDHQANAQTRSENLVPWEPFITEASQRFNIPNDWIEGVMMAESGGKTLRNGRPITSPKGAMGLMQLMPNTYDDMRNAQGLGRDPYNPRDNILAGTAYLRAMFDRFGYPGLFGAYNAGPTVYEASLHGRPLPRETTGYLAYLTRRIPVVQTKPPLFVALSGGDSGQGGVRPAGLFVTLSNEKSPAY